MKLITGTGLGLLVAFAVGVFGGIAWLMVGPLAAVLLWSVLSARSAKHHGWTSGPVRKSYGVRWTSRT
jgi:hypothetical protein